MHRVTRVALVTTQSTSWMSSSLEALRTLIKIELTRCLSLLRAAVTEQCTQGDLSSRVLFHSSGGWEVQFQGASRLVSGEGSPRWLQTATCSWGPHVASPRVSSGREEANSLVSARTPSWMKVLHPHYLHLRKGPVLNSATLRRV